MRKSREEAAETRERIVNAAAQQIAEHGIAETGIAEVMAAAGLTHGGFYKHFGSKDQLIAEAVTKGFETVEGITGDATSKDALTKFLKDYLSKDHRDNYREACPMAALGSELRRADAQTREIATNHIEGMLAHIRSQLGDMPAKDANRHAAVILSAAVGAITLSRMVEDEKLSARILRDTRDFLTHSY